MEEIKNTEIQEEDVELTHSDKLLGVFTNPAGITKQMSKFPAKISDWLIPLLVLIFLTIAVDILFVSVPKLRQITISQQIEQFQERLDKAIEEGKITQEIADQQLSQAYDYIEKGIEGQLFFIELFKLIGIIIGFLIITGLMFAAAKLIYQSEGTYLDTLSAYGLPLYISSLQLIVFVIIALVTNKFFNGFSLSEYVSTDPSTIPGFIVSLVNVFEVWALIIIGIAFKNLMKIKSYIASIVTIFIVWLIFCVIFYYILQVMIGMFFGGAQ